jgi:ligand-binding sensor domain-containing protein
MPTNRCHTIVFTPVFHCSIAATIESLLCVFLLLTPAQLRASSDSIPIPFNHLYSTDGLSHNSVRTIAQDKNGFIWLGTDEGLNRYDGIRKPAALGAF